MLARSGSLKAFRKSSLDVKAPSPREPISESPTHERSSNRSDAIHAPDEASIDRSLIQRNRINNYYKSSRENPGRSQARNSSSKDESGGIRSHSADQRAKFENTDSS